MEIKKQEKEYQKALEYVRNENCKHKGEWLTREAAERYRKRAEGIPEIQDIGERKKLRIELQEKYGLLPVEAINILNGYHIGDYVNKYWHIQNLVPIVGKGIDLPIDETWE